MQGLARLQYLLHSGSIAVLYGQTGVGKSTLLKLFLSQIPQNLFLPIYLHFTHLKSSSLLSLIVSQLGEIPKHTKDRLFLQIMDKSLRSNLTPIIVIDEAHLLKIETITDLRLLVSSPLDSSTNLKIILSGQEHLKYILKRNIHGEHSQFFVNVCVIGAKQRCQGLILLYVSLKNGRSHKKPGMHLLRIDPTRHESCKGCGKPVPRWRGT